MNFEDLITYYESLSPEQQSMVEWMFDSYGFKQKFEIYKKQQGQSNASTNTSQGNISQDGFRKQFLNGNISASDYLNLVKNNFSASSTQSPSNGSPSESNLGTTSLDLQNQTAQKNNQVFPLNPNNFGNYINTSLTSLNTKLEDIDKSKIDLNNITPEQKNELEKQWTTTKEIKKGKVLTAEQLQNRAIKTQKVAAYTDAGADLLAAGYQTFGGQSGTQNTSGTIAINQISAAGEQLPGVAGKVLKTIDQTGQVANATYNKIDEYQDQSFGTQLFGSNVLGVLGVNNYGSKRFGNFGIDPTLRAQIGAAYGGSMKNMDYVANNISGKKVGTFDVGKMQNKWDIAQNQYQKTAKILADANDILARSSEMTAINNNRREYELAGGYDLSSVYAAKQGMKLDIYPEFEYEEAPLDQIETAKEGTKFEWQYEEAPENLKIPKENNWYEDYADKQSLIDLLNSSEANFVQRLKDYNRKYITNWQNPEQISTHKLSYGLEEVDGKNQWVVYPKIQQGESGELRDFTDPKWNHKETDAWDSAYEHKDYVIVPSEEDAKWLTTHYKEFYPTFEINKFAKGGQFNVIPEGALHAHKHNMDTDLDITKKGVPVVDNQGNQQAEIELNEIIFRLEVTQLIEELLKEYESENTSQKEKDEYAIEAGKLLVDEILYNTQDRTNLIEQI